MSFGNFVWQNGMYGSAPWVVDSTEVLAGQTTLRSASVGVDYSGSVLATGVFDSSAPVMSWQVKTRASNVVSDGLNIFLNTADDSDFWRLFPSIDGETEWAPYAFDPSTLPAGEYYLSFEYYRQPNSLADTVVWIGDLFGFPQILGRSARLAAPAPLGVPTLRVAASRVTPSLSLAVPAPLGVPTLRVARVPQMLVSAAPALGVPRMGARSTVAVPAAPVSMAPRARLLSDALPIRSVAALPAWRAEAGGRYLPWVYGRATLSPVPIDAAGLEWLVADHPVVAIERVIVGGVETQGWQLVQRLDGTGRAVAVLRLTQAPPSGHAPAVTVIGRRHPVSGIVLEHPADIAADLLRQCGWSTAADAFQGLRDAWPGLALGLVIDNPIRLREALGGVMEPLGAWWRTDPPRAGRRLPGAPVVEIDAALADHIGARAESAQLATVAHVRYAHDWATGAARGAMTLVAPEAVRQFGELETTIDLPAVRTARDALAVGSVRLARLARPLWQIDATVPARVVVSAGDTVQLAHPRVPAGAALVLATSFGDSRSITAELSVGEVPRIELARRAQALDADTADNRVRYRDGVATFRVTDDYGAPLAGATVTLDGQQTRETDRGGQVQFKTAQGPHTLTVFAHGFAPFVLEVVV